jgi:hypothetical protein
MIDNFELIKPLLEFPNDDIYYHLQILRRGKDHPELKYLAQRAYEGDFKKIWKSWNTCAGEIKGEEPRWIVDIDAKTYDEIFYISKLSKEISDFIDYKCDPKIDPINVGFDTKIIAEIPTKFGYHLITIPFKFNTIVVTSS